ARSEPSSTDADATDATPVNVGTKTWSDRGGMADKDFAECTTDEQSRIAAALDALHWTPGVRRTRRWVGGRGSRIDVRRAVAASRRTGGDVAVLPRRRRQTTPRPLVVLCDVSGSMERYSRILLLFAHAVMKRRPRVEAFVFSTELTRVTRQMRRRRPDAALAAMSRAVPDWSGGTRMGASLRSFNQRWARQVLNGGPMVLLISDGWDRGDPAELQREMARLQRSCHRLVWLNPLLGTENYAPLTRGLQAALPFVDDFLPARTLTNFADLASHLNVLGGPRRTRGHAEASTIGSRR
ncbi:MAG TPA: VWA domain-containing protein, partial [Vicinamibacterales bacterium]